jgi:hypothetical protein
MIIIVVNIIESTHQSEKLRMKRLKVLKVHREVVALKRVDLGQVVAITIAAIDMTKVKVCEARLQLRLKRSVKREKALII